MRTSETKLLQKNEWLNLLQELVNNDEICVVHIFKQYTIVVLY